jgi:hypothetical protein
MSDLKIPVLSDSELQENSNAFGNLYKLIGESGAANSEQAQTAAQGAGGTVQVQGVDGAEIQQQTENNTGVIQEANVVLNGAQIDAAVTIVQQLALGTIGPDTAASLLSGLGIPDAEIQKMLAEARAMTTNVAQQTAAGTITV